MEGERLGRSMDAAMTPMVAALAPWGVRDGHWLPDRDGQPVVWLRTATEAERVTLGDQGWLLAQVQVTLSRLGVPHDIIWRLRLETTSLEAERRLFD